MPNACSTCSAAAHERSAGLAASPPLLARTRAELAAARAAWTQAGPVVLVPTMGALHAGHERLLRAARTLAGPRGSVVVSIFVNPLQFGPGEDLDRYPRTLDEDLACCAREGAQLVFAPSAAEMYPGGKPEVTVDPGPVGQVFEGEFRPGFFGGVLTVVLKLLHLTRPAMAVFGQKDAQQLALVRRMVTDPNLDIAIEPCRPCAMPTGSRPRAGTATCPRPTGPWRSRCRGRCGPARPGPPRVSGTRPRCSPPPGKSCAAEPALAVDYVAVVDPGTFGPAGPGQAGPALLVAAAKAGGTRLIDNVPVVLAAAARRRPLRDAATEGSGADAAHH